MAESFHACWRAPFATIGILTDGEYITRIAFLPRQRKAQAPRTAAAAFACEQLAAYLADPAFKFTLPLSVSGTLHQMAVWRAIQQIPSGETRSYGQIAQSIKSAPRAIGGACGANPVPLIIPCHRVVSKSGLGGFMGAREGDPLKIKAWLLAHERR